MNTGFLARSLTARLKQTGLVTALIACLIVPAQLRADGCFVAAPFVWDKYKDINEPTQKAIMIYDAGHEDLILQVKYDGPVQEFGWLVPVPSQPTVETGSMECFYELSRYTQEKWEPPMASATQKRGMELNTLDAAGGPQVPAPVKVVEIKTVGAYEVAVLSASDPGKLETWLAANGFSYPQDKADVINDYVQKHWYFVAIKIDAGKTSGFKLVSAPRQAAAVKSIVAEKLSTGELQPLQIGFASGQCVFPFFHPNAVPWRMPWMPPPYFKSS